MSKFPRSTNFTNDRLLELADKLGTPFWAYDADIIAERVNQLRRFDVIRYAQKACSNVNILRLVKSLGTKIDSVSPGEIERALVAGFRAGTAESEIVFTADVIDDETCERALELKIPINCGSIDMLREVGRRVNADGHHVWIRINPGE
jgi:diaminopimelate decarboxylase